MNKITLSELKEFIIKASTEELQYELGYYCDPHRTLLREKKYEYKAADRLKAYLSKEIAHRCMESLLLDEMLTDVE